MKNAFRPGRSLTKKIDEIRPLRKQSHCRRTFDRTYYKIIQRNERMSHYKQKLDIYVPQEVREKIYWVNFRMGELVLFLKQMITGHEKWVNSAKTATYIQMIGIVKAKISFIMSLAK